MPAIILPAKAARIGGIEWQPREHDHAVIALLAVERGMLVAEPLEALEREFVVRAFGLLQTEHVRPHRLDETGDEIDAESHRIDVPGRDLDLHARRELAKKHCRGIPAIVVAYLLACASGQGRTQARVDNYCSIRS